MKEERMSYLDGWRGFAILMVLIAHFGPTVKMDIGRFGVDLFFVLSGLLMSRILFQQRMPIGKFYRRRVARILPVFLLFVTVCWIGWSEQSKASWQELVTTLTFTRTYFTHPSIWNSALPDGNLWSLNVEEQCYVILATIATFSVLRRRATLILFALAALTLPAVKMHMRLHTEMPYLLTIECASAGLFLSAAYRTISEKLTVPKGVATAALVGASLCYLGIGPWYLPITISPVLLAFAVNHIQDSPPAVIRVFEWAPLRHLGVLSYSIYLWQEIFMRYKAEFPFHTAVVFALVAGGASFYWFEAPARKWLNSRWTMRSGVQPSPIMS